VKLAAKKSIFVYICIFILLSFWLFPIIWILLTSLKNNIQALAIPPVWIFKPTLQNYSKLLFDGKFQLAILNSIIVAGISTCIVMLLALPAGYALARFRMKHKEDIAFYVISTKMAPPIVVLFSFYLWFSKIGLIQLEFPLSVIILHITYNLPLSIWLLRGFFEGIPWESEEAAKVDGANQFQILRWVTIPIAMPGILITTTLCLMFSWTEFLFASTVSSPNTMTMSVLMFTWLSYVQIEWGLITAGGILYALPILIIAIIIRKHLVEGMSFGLAK